MDIDLPNPNYLRPHKPCPECPFRNTSLRGYFGPYSADYYWRAVHGNGTVQCHTTTKLPEGKQRHCTGAVLCRVKVVKLPYTKEQRDHQEKCLEKYGTDNILGWDFKEYHSIEKAL